MNLSLSRGPRLCATLRADPFAVARSSLSSSCWARNACSQRRARVALGLQVRRVAAAEPVAALSVGPEVARVEVDDLAADVLEERPVVAGHQHHAGQVDEERLEELDRAVVEMVGRLVEQHARGPSRDEGRQGQPGALTAGHRRDELVRVERAEARAGRPPRPRAGRRPRRRAGPPTRAGARTPLRPRGRRGRPRAAPGARPRRGAGGARPRGRCRSWRSSAKSGSWAR